MGITCIKVQCPECGAALKFEEERVKAFCSYCGTEVLIHNENEFTFRHIDEADLRRAETDEKIKLRQIELSEKERSEAREADKERITQVQFLFVLGASNILIFGSFNEIFCDGDNPVFKGMIFLGIIAVILAIYNGLNLSGMQGVLNGLLEMIHDRDEDELEELRWLSNDMIDIPDNIGNYKLKSYKAVAALFESAGFTNIQCVSLGDLRIGLINKPGMVESISIDGKDLDTDKSHHKDASVVILYHSIA